MATGQRQRMHARTVTIKPATARQRSAHSSRRCCCCCCCAATGVCLLSCTRSWPRSICRYSSSSGQPWDAHHLGRDFQTSRFCWLLVQANDRLPLGCTVSRVHDMPSLRGRGGLWEGEGEAGRLAATSAGDSKAAYGHTACLQLACAAHRARSSLASLACQRLRSSLAATAAVQRR